MVRTDPRRTRLGIPMPQSHFVYAREIRSDRRRDSARVRGSGAAVRALSWQKSELQRERRSSVAGADIRHRLRFSKAVAGLVPVKGSLARRDGPCGLWLAA